MKTKKPKIRVGDLVCYTHRESGKKEYAVVREVVGPSPYRVWAYWSYDINEAKRFEMIPWDDEHKYEYGRTCGYVFEDEVELYKEDIRDIIAILK